MLMRGPRTSPNEWTGICSHLPSRGLQPLSEKSDSSNVSRDSTPAETMPMSSTGHTWHHGSTHLITSLFLYVTFPVCPPKRPRRKSVDSLHWLGSSLNAPVYSSADAGQRLSFRKPEPPPSRAQPLAPKRCLTGPGYH